MRTAVAGSTVNGRPDGCSRARPATPPARLAGAIVDRTYDYRPVPFFLMAFVVTWIPWSVAAYAGSQNLESYASLFNLVGLRGPLAVRWF